jgi:hypothetical protein
MGTNFYDHFKNKELMLLFKRLCVQNQERKFNALWKMLDQMTAEQAKERARAQSSEAALTESKPFSRWIAGQPKEKWSFLYDTDGMRYGIQTTNHAECYNGVMRPCRGFPLVGVVEFILYGCIKYFRERYMAANLIMQDSRLVFCARVSEYMKKKIEKAPTHRVLPVGTKEQRFRVACKDRTGCGIRRDRVVQETLITEDGKVFCTCRKPQLIHLPCSHVIASCQESGLAASSFVSPYFRKEVAVETWGHEIYDIGIVGPFVTENHHKTYVPHPDLKRGRGRRQSRRIRNGMDESEAGKAQKRCSICGALGHNYKRCPTNAIPGHAEAGPSGNPEDGAAPSFQTPVSRRAPPRRSFYL